MDKILLSVDICIGAGGVAALERCCLGIPSIVFVYANNQSRGVNALAEAGAILYAGDYRKNDWQRVFYQSLNRIADFHIRKSLSAKASALCDGLGCERVSSYIEAKIFEPDLKPLDDNDQAIILAWRNDPNVRSLSINQDFIEIATHNEWFQSVLKDPNHFTLMCWLGTKRVGLVRYQLKGNECTVSIMVNPLYKKLGFGSFMLKNSIIPLKKAFPLSEWVDARIHAANLASLKLFKKAGYQDFWTSEDWVTKRFNLMDIKS